MCRVSIVIASLDPALVLGGWHVYYHALWWVCWWDDIRVLCPCTAHVWADPGGWGQLQMASQGGTIRSGSAIWEYMFRIAHTHAFKCNILRSQFLNYQNTYIFSFSSVQDPRGIERGRWPGTLRIQTFPYWGVSTSSTRASFSGEWPILCALQESSLPGTTKAKLASLLHTAHPWWEMPLKDPKVRLTAELGPRGRTLQEQLPGAPAWVQSQKQAQSGCWLWPHQPLDGKLAGANKAKAASQPASQS